MKWLTIVVAVLGVGSAVAAGKTSSRDALVDRIEATYLQTSVFSAESPLMDLFLQAPKAANHEATPETWTTVKKELAAALNSAMTAKGGALDTVLRRSMENLTDKELARLATLLSDPAYAKFQAALASPETQKQMLQAVLGDASRITTAVNGVLASHGLVETH